jgi:hypothetical protein
LDRFELDLDLDFAADDVHPLAHLHVNGHVMNPRIEVDDDDVL